MRWNNLIMKIQGGQEVKDGCSQRYFTSYLVDAEATFQNGQLQATSIEELSGEVSEKVKKKY